MNVTNNTTLQLPPDGVFNCTMISVASGATLTFSNNALNMPVYLLATGDVTIDGTVDVSGQSGVGIYPGSGGPGGFAGGYGGLNLVGPSAGGDGCGPGGGTAISEAGVYGNPSSGNTNTYGSLLLEPLVGGSGGAGVSGVPGYGGGGGGGAVLIASNSKITVNGAINSSGGTSGGYIWGHLGGSGGAIRLLAPIVTGTGSLGTPGSYWTDSVWGHILLDWGRIRIDCTDNQAYRTLNLITVASRGSRMIVFPTVIPRLDLVEVAGNAIPEGTNNAVQFELSTGASTNQTVKVQARNFTNDVPIRVVVTPENGPSGSFDAVILRTSGNPPSTTVNVIIPTGSACQINAWTR
jgi:hypothetical protein